MIGRSRRFHPDGDGPFVVFGIIFYERVALGERRKSHATYKHTKKRCFARGGSSVALLCSSSSSS